MNIGGFIAQNPINQKNCNFLRQNQPKIFEDAFFYKKSYRLLFQIINLEY
jgi:hypothetical protein